MNETPHTSTTNTAADQATADRLARLAARRSGSPAAAAPSPATGGPASTTRTRRRHAAKGSRAAALVLSIATTGGLSAVFAHQAAATTNPATSAASTGTGSTGTNAASTSASTTVTGTGTATTAAASTAAASTATASTAATGTATYTGAVVSTRYGNVQVAITTSGGVITDVTALQLPSGGKNTTINAAASPILRTEVLTAQSSSIDVVTGATYTSKGYTQSLQVAIDAAVSAGALAG